MKLFLYGSGCEAMAPFVCWWSLMWLALLGKHCMLCKVCGKQDAVSTYANILIQFCLVFLYLFWNMWWIFLIHSFFKVISFFLFIHSCEYSQRGKITQAYHFMGKQITNSIILLHSFDSSLALSEHIKDQKAKEQVIENNINPFYYICQEQIAKAFSWA